MKFFSKLFLILVLILVAVGCSPEATSNGSDAPAQADGGSGDSSIVGNIDTTSNDVVSTDKVDNDTTSQTDVGGGDSDVPMADEVDAAKPFCPQPSDPAEATLEIQLADKPQCFIPGTTGTKMVSKFVGAKIGIGNHPLANLMPADPAKPDGTGGCSLQTIHNTDYCYPSAKIYGRDYKPVTWEGSKIDFLPDFYLVLTYPETKPLVITEVAFKEGQTGICSLESAMIQDYYQDKVNYSTVTDITDVLQCESGTCSKPDQYKFN